MDIKEVLSFAQAYLREQMGLLLAIGGGITVSILTSDRQSFTAACARVAAGTFCATVLTDPFLDFMAFDPDVYRNAIAGIFAMSGYALSRFAANWDRKTLLDVIRALRGIK